MPKEIEISYNNINIPEFRKKLSAIGLNCKHERRLMERRKFKFKEDKDRTRFARVRNEGNKITMTVKYPINGDMSDIVEHEVEVSDFDEACEIFKALGMEEQKHSSKYREEWVDKDGDVSIVIDEYKHLNPLVEIEGKSWEVVRKYSDLLGFDYAKHFDGGEAYKFYRLQYNCGKDFDFNSNDYKSGEEMACNISWKGSVFVVDRDIDMARLVPEMAEELYGAVDRNRLHLRPNLGWVDKMKSAEDELKFIESVNRDFISNFAIIYKNKIVGTIDFHDHNKEKNEVDIGYWITEEYQGKGIVTKCCERMLSYGFECLRFNKITIHMNVENLKSEAVAKRLGMKFTGIDKGHSHVSDDRVLDAKRYEITAEEYRKLFHQNKIN